ncbi:hypothetical protein Tco_0648900, partial [Tanacetum coccineum]
STNCSMVSGFWMLKTYDSYSYAAYELLQTNEIGKYQQKETQRALNATVRFVRTDNGTEFVNKTLDGWFESVAPLFLWAEAVAHCVLPLIDLLYTRFMEEEPIMKLAEGTRNLNLQYSGYLITVPILPNGLLAALVKSRRIADIGLAPQHNDFGAKQYRTQTYCFTLSCSIPPVVRYPPVIVPDALGHRDAMVLLPQQLSQKALSAVTESLITSSSYLYQIL